jgi:hypothetical protein
LDSRLFGHPVFFGKRGDCSVAVCSVVLHWLFSVSANDRSDVDRKAEEYPVMVPNGLCRIACTPGEARRCAKANMKRIVFTLLLFALCVVNAHAFDYATYELRDLDQVIRESKVHGHNEVEGQRVMIPPPRIHLYETVAKYPFKCDGTPTTWMLAMALNRTIEEMPFISNCMLIESRNGEKIAAFIQDSIAPFVEKEYRIGDKIHLWSVLLFVNSSDKKPYFVVHGIGEAEQSTRSGEIAR